MNTTEVSTTTKKIKPAKIVIWLVITFVLLAGVALIVPAVQKWIDTMAYQKCLEADGSNVMGIDPAFCITSEGQIFYDPANLPDERSGERDESEFLIPTSLPDIIPMEQEMEIPENPTSPDFIDVMGVQVEEN
jgi:hypothetical protein